MTLNNSSINYRNISRDLYPYIIVEVSANHNGSILRAKETILAKRNAGFDAVKIQAFKPDTMLIEADNPYFYINYRLWKARSLYDLYSEGDDINEVRVQRSRPRFGLEAKCNDLVIGAKCLMSAKSRDRVNLKHFDVRND